MQMQVQESQCEQLQRKFRSILKKIPKLPCLESEITKILDDEIKSINKVNDKNLKQKLLYKMLQVNKQSIQQLFLSFMNRIFFQIQKCQLTKTSLPQLDKIIQSNLQNIFPNNFKFQNKSNNKMIQQNQTPGNDLVQFNDVDMFFSHLFDRFHQCLKFFAQYFQIQHLNLLEQTIYDGFYKYATQNQLSFLNNNKQSQQHQYLQNENKQPQKCSSKLNKNEQQLKYSSKLNIIKQPQNYQKSKLKISQQFVALNEQLKFQKQAPNESELMNELIDIVIQKADNKQLKNVSQVKMIKQSKNRSGIQLLQKVYSLYDQIKQKGLSKVLANTIKTNRSKYIQQSLHLNNNQQVMNLTETILKSHFRYDVNLQRGLNQTQYQLVLNYIKEGNKDDFDILQFRFTQDQKEVFVQAVYQIIQTHKQSSNHFYIEHLQKLLNDFLNLNVKNQNQFQANPHHPRNSLKKGITTTLSKINTISELPNLFYLVPVLLNRFQNEYYPGTRRLIIKLLHMIQKQVKQMTQSNINKKLFQNLSLVHALKLLQSANIQRSQLCQTISSQPICRQISAQQSKIITQSPDLQHQLNRIYIFQHKKQHQRPPKLQLLKLTSTKKKKNVTILVSGFLSEDTDKFEEWKGFTDVAYDTQVYALKWQSKTIEHILQFTINTCRDIFTAGAGLSFIAGPYIKAAFILKQVFNKYKQNPFNPAFQIATLTGIYLADLLISLFDGHFINLVGFSLGTQVVVSAMLRLKQKGKLHLINRLITIGGAASCSQILNCLDTCTQTQSHPIQISWTNLHCKSDNILRYLLKVSIPFIDPIGLGLIKEEGIKKQQVYQVDDIDVGAFIKGHLQFRNRMGFVARIIGFKDQ